MTPVRIDAWMPTYDVSEYHQRDVAAPPEDAYAALRHVDLATAPLVRALFAVRGLARPGGLRSYTLDGFVAAGFTLLEEIPGQEIVLGLTGRFWRPTGNLLRLAPQAFGAFDRPGWAQAAWNFRVAPSGPGCVISTETRVRTTDERARRMFRRYWRLVGPFSGLIRRQMLAQIAAGAERSRL